MTRLANFLVLSALLLWQIPLFAGWSGGIEGGTVLRDEGNSTRLRLKLTNDNRPLNHYIYADWIRSTAGNDSYEAGYKPRFWFNETLYVFGDGRVRVDKVLSIDNEKLLLAGAGAQFISTEQQSLWAELGAGKRDTKFVNGANSTETLGVLRMGFYQVLQDLIRFELDLNAVKGEALTETQAEAGVSVRTAGGAIKFSYRIRRFTPETGPAIEDSDTSVSFNYSF